MYSMKQVCEATNLTYETLKYYCNEGLVPNVKRDKNNHRIFDDNDNRIVNDVSRAIKTVDELNNTNIKKKNNFELK